MLELNHKIGYLIIKTHEAYQADREYSKENSI